jgi:hypothetical protein
MIPARVEMSKVLARPGTPTRGNDPAEESDQYLLNDLILAYDHLLDLCDDLSFPPISSTWARSHGTEIPLLLP